VGSILDRKGHCVICVAEGAGQVRPHKHRPRCKGAQGERPTCFETKRWLDSRGAGLCTPSRAINRPNGSPILRPACLPHSRNLTLVGAPAPFTAYRTSSARRESPPQTPAATPSLRCGPLGVWGPLLVEGSGFLWLGIWTRVSASSRCLHLCARAIEPRVLGALLLLWRASL
jgi:hypothetical protein